MVLLHGLPTSGAVWDRVCAGLPGRRVLRPDLPAHGDTPALADAGMESQLAWLEGVLAGVDRPHLVGHDYGGVLAALWASRHPTASLTLGGTALGPWWWLSQAAAAPPFHRLFYDRWAGARYLAAGVEPAERAAFVDRFRRDPDPAWAAWMRATARGIDRRRLGALRIEAPVLCLWGRRDRYFPAAAGRRIAARFGGRFVLLEARHYAQWSAAGAFTAALAAFWEEVAEGASGRANVKKR